MAVDVSHCIKMSSATYPNRYFRRFEPPFSIWKRLAKEQSMFGESALSQRRENEAGHSLYFFIARNALREFADQVDYCFRVENLCVLWS